jgi:hypothetical protein
MRTTPVSKCLDKRLLLFGFEVFDLLAVFLVLSILNFIFGSASMKLIFVWLPTLSLAALLRFGKKGKPDKFLVHWVRFQTRPGYYSAFKEPSVIEASPTLGRNE